MTDTKPTTPQPAAPPKAPLSTRQKQRLTLRDLFNKQRLELANLLPKNMSIDRLYRIALSECLKQPKLLECSQESWALAMQTCASQGLYPDSGLGQMFLIASNNYNKALGKKVMEVRAQRGYQGDLKLIRNSGELKSIWAEVVYKADHFVEKKGTERSIVHEPNYEVEDRGPLRFAYAVAILQSGEANWVVLSERDIKRHRDASESFKFAPDNSPWTKHPESMWKKSALRELYKIVPHDTEKAEQVAVAIATDGAPGAPGGPALDIAALEGVELPEAPEEPKSALDRLAGEAGDPPPPPGESPYHTKDCPPNEREAANKKAASLFVGRSVVCNGCNDEIPGTVPCPHPKVKLSDVDSLRGDEFVTCPDCKVKLTKPPQE
jgi:recombination protein RecT